MDIRPTSVEAEVRRASSTTIEDRQPVRGIDSWDASGCPSRSVRCRIRRPARRTANQHDQRPARGVEAAKRGNSYHEPHRIE